MALSRLVVRSNIGAWTDIPHIITHGLDIAEPPPEPVFTDIATAQLSMVAGMGTLFMTSAGSGALSIITAPAGTLAIRT